MMLSRAMITLEFCFFEVKRCVPMPEVKSKIFGILPRESEADAANLIVDSSIFTTKTEEGNLSVMPIPGIEVVPIPIERLVPAPVFE